MGQRREGTNVVRSGGESDVIPGEFNALAREFSTPVARTDLGDYIRHLEINVGCYDEDALNEYIVGKLAMDQILWANALVDGVPLFEICDSDSQGLHEVHTILTKGKQDFRSDLKIKEITNMT